MKHLYTTEISYLQTRCWVFVVALLVVVVFFCKQNRSRLFVLSLPYLIKSSLVIEHPANKLIETKFKRSNIIKKSKRKSFEEILNENKILEFLIDTFTIGYFISNSHPQSTATFRVCCHPWRKITHNSLSSTETTIIHCSWLTFHAHWFR